VNSGTSADEHCEDDGPSGWSEPGPTPKFDEYRRPTGECSGTSEAVHQSGGAAILLVAANECIPVRPLLRRGIHCRMLASFPRRPAPRRKLMSRQQNRHTIKFAENSVAGAQKTPEVAREGSRSEAYLQYVWTRRLSATKLCLLAAW